MHVYMYLSIYLRIYLSVCLPIYPSTDIQKYTYLYRSIYLSISTSASIYLSLHSPKSMARHRVLGDVAARIQPALQPRMRP